MASLRSGSVDLKRKVFWVGLLPAVLASLLLFVNVGSARAAPDREGGGYVVQRGDTLTNIAARFGVSLAALVQTNGISNPNLIITGQRLTIPGKSAATSTEISGSGAATATSSGIHVVRAGDTLATITAHYGVTLSDLATANRLLNVNVIYTGQRLTIPRRSSASGATAAPAAKAALSGRWIDINLSRQRLTAYQGNIPVFSTLISGGTSRHPTVVGRYAVRIKLRAQTMSGPGYHLPNVPWVMYFYAGYAIHGTYWHNNFGRPMSHGCVNLRTRDAAWLYSWASVGTPVVTHW